MLVGQWLFLIVCFFGAVVGSGHHVVVQVLTLRSRGTAARARQPLTFTLGAMRNLLLFSVSPVAVFAVGSLVGFSALFSRLAVGLFALPVLVLLWVAGSGFVVGCAFRAASFFRAAVCAGLFSALRCRGRV